MSQKLNVQKAECPIKLNVRKAERPVAECPKAECPGAECLSAVSTIVMRLTQVAAAYESTEAVRLLLEKGFVPKLSLKQTNIQVGL